jgi:hypothetical protein
MLGWYSSALFEPVAQTRETANISWRRSRSSAAAHDSRERMFDRRQAMICEMFHLSSASETAGAALIKTANHYVIEITP